MMMNELNFVFNTNRLFLGGNPLVFKDCLDADKIIYSSPDLLVYMNGSIEVMISDVGTVSMAVNLDNNTDIKVLLPSIFNEYKKLTNINKMFTENNYFKIISPKDFTNNLTNQLKILDYKFKVTDTIDCNTLFVTN